MNKKVNTLLFILGATAFNVISAVAGIILLYILFSIIASKLGIGPDWVFPVSFLGGIVASFFIYRAVLKLVTKKIDMEKHFDPIFVNRNFKRNQQP